MNLDFSERFVKFSVVAQIDVIIITPKRVITITA